MILRKETRGQEPAAFVVDFRRVEAAISPQSLGICCTTYGRTPLTNREQADAEAGLDFRYVRIPVGVRQGRVTSSAAGGPKDLDMPQLARWYQKRGCRIVAVLGGRTNDVDIAPGDAERIAREFGAAGVDLDGVDFSSPNEPNNQGWDMERTIPIARQCSDELRRVKPGLKLWGPEWAYYDSRALRKWIEGMGDRPGGVLFHHYAMGVSSLSTTQALQETALWGREVRETRAALRAAGLPERVSVTELNFSWRFEDGTPPDKKNRRFFTAVNTVWTASVFGHILSAGGSGAVYGNQNGPLSVFSQEGSPESNRPASSPMPAYWGLAAWTGARRFPHFADRVFAVERTAPDDVELFAVRNETKGINLVTINKSESQSRTVSVQLRGIEPGVYDLWQANQEMPFAAPQRLGQKMPFRQQIEVSLPPMTVSTLVLKASLMKS